MLDGADDEEDETDDRCGAGGEDCAGGVAGEGDCGRPGAALSGASEQVDTWKKQLQEHAARTFDPKVGQGGRAVSQTERDIEQLHAKIGQLTIGNDFFAKVEPQSESTGR